MNDFLDTLNALIVANGLDPNTVTLAQLIALYTDPGNGGVGEYDYRGFGKPSENGSVRIRGIDKLKEELTNNGRADIAELIPTWHITDYWNNNQSASLEGINTLDVSDYAKNFLNRNLNKWFFRPGGVSGKPTIPTSWAYYVNGLQTPWGGVWSSYDAGRRAPFSPAENVSLVNSGIRPEWKLNGEVVSDTYCWPMAVDCTDTKHHVGYWKAYAEAITGLTLNVE